jgi:hypothetical protein
MRNFKTIAAGTALVGAAALGLGACGGSPATTTQWFNDTGEQLVVEFTSPASAPDQANLVMPDDQMMSPQSTVPDTGLNSALCTVTFPKAGITWQVFDTNWTAGQNNAAATECSEIENQPGANERGPETP